MLSDSVSRRGISRPSSQDSLSQGHPLQSGVSQILLYRLGDVFSLTESEETSRNVGGHWKFGNGDPDIKVESAENA